MVCATFRTDPTAISKFQSFIHIAAFAAGLRTWGKAVYLNEIYTIPTAFVFKHRKKHPERCVTDCLCQVVVLHHSFHVQILHAYGTHLAVVRQCIGDFVNVIFTAIGNMFMQPSYADACLVTVGRTFLFAAQPLLKQF